MFYPLYIIWFILPLLLFLLSGWAVAKPVFGVGGREYAGEYFKQALFCLVAFFIAVGLDKLPFDDLILGITAGSTDAVTVAHWLLFPVVLFVMASIHTYYLRVTGKHPDTHLRDGLARYKR